MRLISFAGLPPTTVQGSTFLVTTAPAAMVLPFPMVTPPAHDDFRVAQLPCLQWCCMRSRISKQAVMAKEDERAKVRLPDLWCYSVSQALGMILMHCKCATPSYWLS